MIVEMQAQINSLERKLSSSTTPCSNEITSSASGAAETDLRPAAPVFTPAAATSAEMRTFAAVAVDPTRESDDCKPQENRRYMNFRRDFKPF